MIYRNKAFIYYDEFLCVGDHHYQELNEYVHKFNLKIKSSIKLDILS